MVMVVEDDKSIRDGVVLLCIGCLSRVNGLHVCKVAWKGLT